MADFEIVPLVAAMKRAEATRSSRRVADYRIYLEAISGGRAGLLRPEEGETQRALTLRLQRAAREVGRALSISKCGDGVVFWFTESKRRGRPPKYGAPHA